MSDRISYNSFLKELRVIVMPTSVHDAHQAWINNSLNRMIAQGLLTFQDVENLERYVGTSKYCTNNQKYVYRRF